MWSGSSYSRLSTSSEVAYGNRDGKGNGSGRGGSEAPLRRRVRNPRRRDIHRTKCLQHWPAAARDDYHPCRPCSDQGEPCCGLLHAPAVRTAMDRVDSTWRTRTRRGARLRSHTHLTPYVDGLRPP